MDAEDPLDTVSGTLGFTGAADTVLVLNRDGQGVTLYGRGRDIEEIESAMRFEPDLCRWRFWVRLQMFTGPTNAAGSSVRSKRPRSRCHRGKSPTSPNNPSMRFAKCWAECPGAVRSRRPEEANIPVTTVTTSQPHKVTTGQRAKATNDL